MAVQRPSPDLAGFAEAQDTKRQLVGSDVTFLFEPVNVWPDGTAINPDTGDPFDPTIKPLSSVRPQVVVRCGVFFKAVNRGGAANAAIGSPAGWDERSRIFAIAPYSALGQLRGAVAFIFHDVEWKIDAIKIDEIITGYRRVLLYAGQT